MERREILREMLLENPREIYHVESRRRAVDCVRYIDSNARNRCGTRQLLKTFADFLQVRGVRVNVVFE